MKRFVSIAKTTALEILSEPLSLLVLLAALVIAVLAPAFHYHQFGEPTRMARDAGLSSLLVCGGVLAAFGTIRAFRREIESGTLSMALVHPVSRGGFFLAKAAGALAAFLVFSFVIFAVALTVVEGAAVGGALAAQLGGLARLWGPCLVAGVAVMVLPFLVGAALNRFAGCRFVLSAFVVAAFGAALCAGWTFLRDAALVLRLLPAFVLVVLFLSILLLAAAALSVRLAANAAASALGVLALLLLPAVGNYYLSDALSGGGTISWAYVAGAALAALPADLFFILLGIHFMNGRDIA